MAGRFASIDPAAPLVIAPADWPALDRAAWLRATAPVHSPFRKDQGTTSRNRYSLRAWRCGYGRWLAYLRDSGQLDPAVHPAERLSEERLDGYIADLRAHGNRAQTIISRFGELKGALDILEPGHSFSWVMRPRGVHIQHYFAREPRDKVVHHGATLLAWAQRLFAAGLAQRKPRCRRALVRDAVIIGILVLPAPRLRALASLRVGRNLQRRAEGWVIEQEPEITKMGRAEWCPLDPAVAPMVERYLAVERVELLEGKDSDHLWIAEGGGKLAEASVARQIRLHTGRAFERPFGPHAFRHCLATTSAMDNPSAPLDGATLLGHSDPQTTSRYYNLAKTSGAAARHAERLRRLRGEDND